METVKHLRNYVAEHNDDERIFCFIFDKSDADDVAVESMEETELTNDEWLNVIRKMNTDEGVWEELIQAKNFYIETIIAERKKGNVNSK